MVTAPVTGVIRQQSGYSPPQRSRVLWRVDGWSETSVVALAAAMLAAALRWKVQRDVAGD